MSVYRTTCPLVYYDIIYMLGAIKLLLLLTNPTPAFVGPVIINFHIGLNYLFDIKNSH